MSEHCVRIIVKLSDESWGTLEERTEMGEIEETLESVMGDSEAGEYDGHELGGGTCVFYLYGPNADELFKAIEPTLRSREELRGSSVIKRYGPPDDGVRETTLVI